MRKIGTTLVAFLWAGPLFAADATALAGPNQIVKENIRVYLDGSKSSAGSAQETSFFWTQIDGPEVNLVHANKSNPNFMAPSVPSNTPLLLSFNLSVKGKTGQAAQDMVYVIVSNVNEPPQASITTGEDMVRPGSVVIFDGNKSIDPEGDPLKYLWSQVLGPIMTVSNPFGKEIIFRVPEQLPPLYYYPYTIRFLLEVSDGHGGASAKEMTIKVNRSLPPIASEMGIDSQAKAREKNLMLEAKKNLDMAKDLIEKNNLAEATRFCGRALVVWPGSAEAFSLVKIIEGKVTDFSQEGLQRARQNFVERKYLDAIRGLQKNGAQDETLMQFSIQALEQMAETPAGSDYVETAQDFVRSRNLYRQGLMSYSQGKLDDARILWKKALSLDRNNQMAASALNRVVTELESE